MNQNELNVQKPFLKFQSIPNPKDWNTHILRQHCKREFSHLTEDKKPVFIEHPAVVQMMGTVKAHGTHGDVVVWPDGTVVPQSRNRVLDVFNDNAGWANFVKGLGDEFWLNRTKELSIGDDQIVVFVFEWCGEGIQSVVGISQLEKFALSVGTIVINNANEIESKHGKVGDSDEVVDIPMDKRRIHPDFWLSYPDKRIFNVVDAGIFELIVDFHSITGNVADTFDNVLPCMLDKVENDCPIARMVAKHDGIELKEPNIGEGIVFQPMQLGYGSRAWFKFKGVKHSQAGQKVKNRIAKVDPETRIRIDQFVSEVVTESRCRQGIHYLQEMNMEISVKSLGEYMKWLHGDIMKEEQQRLIDLELNSKHVGKSISNTARGWFMKYHSEFE